MKLLILNRIFYNELIYLEEWYNFHLKQGVDLIYLYIINKVSDEYDYILKKLDKNKIRIIFINQKKYIEANQHINLFLEEFYLNHSNDWISIIDIDEFLYSPLKGKKITDIIDIYEKKKIYAISINWKCFGSNNINKNNDYKILKKFTKCCKKYHGINTETKSLLKLNTLNKNNIKILKKKKILISPHKFELNKGYKYYTTNGIEFVQHNKRNIKKLKQIRDNWFKLLNSKPKVETNSFYLYPEENPYLIINHYIVKSKDEYVIKINNNLQCKNRYNFNRYKLWNSFLNSVQNEDILNKISESELES